MKILFIILILLVAQYGYARGYDKDEWTKSNTKLEATYFMLHIIDWRQTRYIAKNPDNFYEINPILGEHPSVEEVDRFAALSMLGHVTISYLLPKKWRKYWQVGTTVIKLSLIINSEIVGIKIDF